MLTEPSLNKVAAEVARCFSIFLHCNKQRLMITKQLVTKFRWNQLQQIPTLLHVNSHRAPGFVADLGENIGVHGFRLTDQVREQRRDLVTNKRHNLSVGTIGKPLIESIASIGSAGTLALTPKSDFDFWIVCRNDISKTEYELVRRKTDLVKAYLLEQDPTLDIMFYMATPDDVKRHYFGAVSDDSAGSALGRMLKEEFYRTCMVWAGKTPLWWCLPDYVKTNEEYYQWAEILPRTGLPIVEDIMDMGPIERSTLAQYLSAVMWQANKSLGSPFKSLMKLSVVNRYADDPKVEFIAERVRKNVQKNPTHGRNTDPYLNLFDYCASYWTRQQEKDGALMMTEMFYLKILGDHFRREGVAWNERIFQRRAEVRDLMRSWGLTPKVQNKLATMSRWPFSDAMAYQRRTDRFVNKIFKRVLTRLNELGLKMEQGKVIKLRPDADDEAARILSQFANISQKVECFYGTRRAHVSPISLTFRKMLHKQAFALIGNSDPEIPFRWALAEEIPQFLEHRTELGESVSKEEKEAEETAADGYEPTTTTASHIYTNPRLIDVLAWLSANRLIRMRTVLRVMIDSQRRPPAEFRMLTSKLMDLLDHPLYYDEVPDTFFQQPPRPKSALVSFDLDLHSQLRVRDDKSEGRMSKDSNHGTSNQLARLNKISFCEQNTYGRVEVHVVDADRFRPAHVMGRLLASFPQHSATDLHDVLFLHSADTRYHQNFLQEFSQIFFRLHTRFRGIKRDPLMADRIVTKLEDEYVVLTRLPTGKVLASQHRDISGLLDELEKPVGFQVRTQVEDSCDGAERLRAMYRHWRPGNVDLFIKRDPEVCSLHIIDEAGNFFNHRCSVRSLNRDLAIHLKLARGVDHNKLKFGGPLNRSIDVRVADIVNNAHEDGRLYSYQIKPIRVGQDIADALNGLLLAGITPAFGEQPALLEMHLGKQVARIPLKSQDIIHEAAAHLDSNAKHYNCRAAHILGIKTSPTHKGYTIDYLTERRLSEHALRVILDGDKNTMFMRASQTTAHAQAG